MSGYRANLTTVFEMLSRYKKSAAGMLTYCSLLTSVPRPENADKNVMGSLLLFREFFNEYCVRVVSGGSQCFFYVLNQFSNPNLTKFSAVFVCKRHLF